MKNAIYHLIIILINSICSAQAPEIAWDKSYGGTDHESFFWIAETRDNGFIMTGAAYFDDDEFDV